MDQEKYAPKVRLPFDADKAKAFRAELTDAGRKGDFDQAFQAVVDLDLIGEATKTDVLSGLRRLGQSKSWRQNLDDAIVFAKSANHPARVQELVRMALLMECTKGFYQTLWNEAEQEKQAQIEAEATAQALVQQAEINAQIEAARQQAQQQAATEIAAVRAQAKKEIAAAQQAVIQARTELQAVKQQLAAAQAVASPTPPPVGSVPPNPATAPSAPTKKEWEPLQPTAGKSPEWIATQNDIAERWLNLKVLQGKGKTPTFQRLLAAMELIHEDINSGKARRTGLYTRAQLEYLIDKIWAREDLMIAFLDDTDMKNQPYGKNPPLNPDAASKLAKAFYLPIELHKSTDTLTETQKKQIKKLRTVLIVASQPHRIPADADPNRVSAITLFHTKLNEHWFSINSLLS